MPLNHTTFKQEFQVPSAANATVLATLERSGKLCKKKGEEEKEEEEEEEKGKKEKRKQKGRMTKILTGFVIVRVFPLSRP